MAKQTGIFKIEGTLEDVTFYKLGGEFYVRSKSSLDAQRVETDPAFQRTRENANEFKNAGLGSKLVTRSLKPILPRGRWFGKLNSYFLKVVKGDTTSIRGQRNIVTGDIFEAYGFQFDTNIDVFLGNVNIAYTVGGSTVDFEISPFTPIVDIVAGGGATHFRFDIGVCSCDVVSGVVVGSEISEGGYIDVNSAVPTALDSRTLSASTVSGLLVAGVLKIGFYQFLNGVYYALSQDASIICFAYIS
jgi:hypothetical protein